MTPACKDLGSKPTGDKNGFAPEKQFLVYSKLVSLPKG